MYQYLKNNQYYIDRYDLHTIETCLNYYNGIKRNIEKERFTKESKKLSDEEFNKDVNKTVSYAVNIIKAKRYERKKEVIHEWKERDRRVQERYDNAVPPESILCKRCSYPTEVFSKDLHNPHGENSKILFLFECPKCNKRQALYEDGTERRYRKQLCPECNHTLTEKSTYIEDILTTDYSCSDCSYRSKESYDFSKSEKEQEIRETEEKKLLKKYREEFCVSDKVGEEMLRTYKFLSKLYNEFKEKERKNRDPLVQQARQLKTLTMVQLQKHITDSLEKEGFTDLKFGKPEIGKHVIVDFSVLETKYDRNEYNSQMILEKLINRLLEDTNWRLMSNGIDYRLGILTGRLKAYEREEDLIGILGIKKR